VPTLRLLALRVLALTLPAPIICVPTPGISVASKKEGIVKKFDRTQFFWLEFENF